MRSKPINSPKKISKKKQNHLRGEIINSAFQENHKNPELLFNIKQNENNVFIKRIGFNELKKWGFDNNGNLRHESGKFFSIVGAKNKHAVQPIILQPEHGILGIICQMRNGIIQFLMQKKFEPGNINCHQLSPTVQATKSNYTAVHKGKSVPYLNYFFNDKYYAIIKGLLSEQTKRFFQKKNWNIIINLPPEEEIGIFHNFKWITIKELLHLIKIDNYVNMNTRSIISGIQYNMTEVQINISQAAKFYNQLNNNYSQSKKGKDLFVSAQNLIETKHSLIDLEFWINNKRKNMDDPAEIIDLIEIDDLVRTKHRIGITKNNEFDIIALEIKSNREVTHWTQPIARDTCTRITGFLIKRINGILHFLLKSSHEIGSQDGPEFGPTVCGIPLNPKKDNKGSDNYNKFAKYFIQPNKENCYLSVIQSDEGGRFYRVQNKHLIVITNDEIDEGDDFIFASLFQIKSFINKGNYITMEARSIISCINFFE